MTGIFYVLLWLKRVLERMPKYRPLAIFNVVCGVRLRSLFHHLLQAYRFPQGHGYSWRWLSIKKVYWKRNEPFVHVPCLRLMLQGHLRSGTGGGIESTRGESGGQGARTTVCTRMIPVLRWAAIWSRAIFAASLTLAEGKTTIKHTF